MDTGVSPERAKNIAKIVGAWVAVSPNIRMRLVLGKPVAAAKASKPIVALTTSRN
jgi:hypothetical protein